MKNKELKICLLGAGRRYSLVERFQKSGFDVTCVELDKNVPVAKICRVVDNIIEVNISTLCIPLMDLLTVKHCEMDNVLTSSCLAVNTCYNKKKFAKYICQLCQEVYPALQDGDKIVEKPIFGNSSKGINFFDEDYFRRDMGRVDDENNIYQRLIDGTEYSVDCYFKKDKTFFGGVVRSRDRVAGGEVVDSRVSHNDELISYCKKIGENLGLVGPINFQYIIDGKTNLPYIIEINARFGGGSTLSMEAGFDMVDMIKKEYFTKEELKLEDYPVRNLLMKRVFKDTYFPVESN